MQDLKLFVTQVRSEAMWTYHPIISQVGHRQSFDGYKWDLPLKRSYGSTLFGSRDEDVHCRSGLGKYEACGRRG